MRRPGGLPVKAAAAVGHASVRLSRHGRHKWTVRTVYRAAGLDMRTLPMTLAEAKAVRRERRLFVALLAAAVSMCDAMRQAERARDADVPWRQLVGPLRDKAMKNPAKPSG